MKKILIIIGVAGFIALLFLPPRQQETVQTRQTPTRLPFADQGSLLNAVSSQNASTNNRMRLANPSQADIGPMPEFNPPHGQPWHRCEIPVGAPLNPGSQSTPYNAGQTPTQQIASTATASNTARPTLNPPHGEPFHRCDIPVGAPLDSPPRNTNTTATDNNQAGAQTQGTITPIIPSNLNEGQANKPVVTNETPENIGPKPALNPPHGQPWHRCDIRVGDPLP